MKSIHWYFLYFSLLLTSISIMFNTKYSVVQKILYLSSIEKQIKLEKNNIYVLKAELSYLKSPDRINFLQKKHLKLRHITKNDLEHLQ